MELRHMRRIVRAAIGPIMPAMAITLLALTVAGEARAQYGHYGWGGWGVTPFGSAARGMGAFAAGVGEYNLETARAEAIETQAWMRWNDYLWRSRQINRMQYYREASAEEAAEEKAMAALQHQHLYDPTSADIEDGNALNSILFQLDNPAVQPAVMRHTGSGFTLSGQDIQKIPFMFTHKGVAISLQRLAADAKSWPEVLQGEAMKPLRQRYESIVDRILKVPDGKSIPEDLIDEARAVINRMREAVEGADLPGPEKAEALRYLKSHAGMIAMLEEPEVEEVIKKAEKVDQVTLPNLMAFMNVYNLQFDAAKTEEERELYRAKLYPMMAQFRDEIAQRFDGKIPTEPTGQAYAGGSPTDIFGQMDWDQLSGGSGGQRGSAGGQQQAPPPPQPPGQSDSNVPPPPKPQG